MEEWQPVWGPMKSGRPDIVDISQGVKNNGGGDNGKGIRQIFAHWVYVVQRLIYPEFASPNIEVFVNRRPFSEAARMAGAFAGFT